MGERQKLRLPFGGGLDRKTGSAVVDPTAFGNLQNVHLFRGRMELRKGLERALQLGWGEDLIAVEPIRSLGQTVCVVWDSISREVRLYLVDGTLTSSALVGTLWTMPAAFAGRPEVLCAELYNKVAIAHNDASILTRQITKVYDGGTGTIVNLAVDLDRSGGAEDVKFRGVARHLNYLCGWGYGTGADEDRPEVFRISLPGLPGAIATWFVPEHYFLVGAQGDPIIGAGKSGDRFEICKAAEAYGLVGYSRDNFGVVPLDMNHGMLGARLGVTVGSERFRWGLNGPRVSTGGESDDLELPLDLAGPDADPLQSAAEADNAFAVYDPAENEVLFVFDFWAYVLHLKDGLRRWSYRPFAWELGCAGRIYTGGVPLLTLADVVPSAVYVDPSFALTDAPTNYLPKFDVTGVVSGALLGGEQAEIWVRSLYAGDTLDPLGLGYALAQGEWKKRATVAATAITATILGMHFHTDHEIAIRLTMDGVPGIGYFGTPDQWPGTSRITVLAGGTVQSYEPTLGYFSRTSASTVQRGMTYVGPGVNGRHLQPQLSYVVERDAGAGYAGITGDELTLSQPNADVGVSNTYRIKVVGPDGESAFVASAAAWLGPEAPSAVSIAPDIGHLSEYELDWTNGAHAGGGDRRVEGQVEEDALNDWGVTSTSTIDAVFLDGVDGLCPTALTDIRGRVRTKLTTFAVDDFSDWVITGNDTPANC